MMGLFWGSKKNVPVPQPAQQQELTEHEKLKQKLSKPMELGFIFADGGPMKADPEFSYLIRRIDDAAYKNNCIVREIRDLVRGLATENQALKQRVEQLEQQVSNTRQR